MKADRYHVETESAGTVEVLVAPTMRGAWVSVGPVLKDKLGTVVRPVVWVADLEKDLLGVLPN